MRVPVDPFPALPFQTNYECKILLITVRAALCWAITRCRQTIYVYAIQVKCNFKAPANLEPRALALGLQYKKGYTPNLALLGHSLVQTRTK